MIAGDDGDAIDVADEEEGATVTRAMATGNDDG